MTQTYFREFSYGLAYRISTFTTWIIGLISLPLNIASIVIVYRIITRSWVFSTFSWDQYVGLSALLYATVFWLMPEANKYTNIHVNDNGLRVRVLFLYPSWKFIPWSEVIKLEESNVRDLALNPVRLLHVKNCTLWHRILAKRYLSSWDPVIVISPGMNNFYDLIEFIEGKMAGGNKFE